MSSLELLKKKPPKYWWTPILVVILYSVIQGVSWQAFISPFISDEIMGNLLSFSFGLIFILIWVKFIERHSLKTLGFHKQDCLKNIFYGLVLGAISVAIIVFIIMIFGGLSFQLSGYKNFAIILLMAILFSIQGFTEEVVFRGYLMNRVASLKGRKWAVVVNSVFFAIFHAGNPSISYVSSLNLIIVGIFFSILFWYTDNMWLISAFHAVWNFSIGVLLGINVSGIELPYKILKANIISNNIYLNGGSFGIEGSIVVTIYFVLFSILLYMLLYVQMFKKIANNK